MEPSRDTESDARGTWPIVKPGVWCLVRREPLPVAGPSLFLDRDGVIVEDNGFIGDPAKVELRPGAVGLIAAVNRRAMPVAVVTNQSGIARGLFGWSEFASVEQEIERRLEIDGARLDAVLACPFHPEFTPDYGEVQAHWRKPGPGLVLEAARLLNVDLGRSWLIGDQSRDIEAARNAGLAGAIFLSGEAPERSRSHHQGGPDTGFQTLIAETNFEALSILQDVGLLGD